jgi:DNA polymerase I-like protein with 3'-5' exonuclease and polymerase domains
MIIGSIDHAKRVLDRFYQKWEKKPQIERWLVLDTETEPRLPYKASKDALVIGRARIKTFSLCYFGESYSAPTDLLHPKFPPIEDWVEWLIPIAENKGITKVFHNANYDLNVFFYEGLSVVKPIWDTMLGCWKANAELEKGLKTQASLYGRHIRKTATVDFSSIEDLTAYAEEDVIQTDELMQMQRLGYVFRNKIIQYCNSEGLIVSVPSNFPPGKLVVPNADLDPQEVLELRLQELPYLRSTIRAERYGFPVSRVKLNKARAVCAAKKDKIAKECFKYANKDVNLRSSKQLINLFGELGINIPFKTAKGKPSVNAKSLYFMAESHPIVSLLKDYRGVEKMESFLGRPNPVKPKDFGLEYFCDSNGVIRSSISTCGAVTGRTSSSLPNLTQIPASKDQFGVRACFVPPKGMSLLCLDYAQLELRVAALWTRDPAFIKILCDPKGDIHQNTANEFGVKRNPTAKQINFLLLYGGGGKVLSDNLTLAGVPTTKTVAWKYVERYNQVYRGIVEGRLALLEAHKRNGYIRTFIGRKRQLFGIDWDNEYSRHKAETTLSNNTTQGCLCPDTRLLTKQGLQDIVSLMQTMKVGKIGRRIWTGNAWELVTDVFSVGQKPLWKVTLSDGSVFNVSDTHLWKNELGEWVKTSSLRVGEYLQQSTTFVPKNLTLNRKPSEAEFVGFMIGDGTYSRTDLTLVSKKDSAIAAREELILTSIFSRSGWTVHQSSKIGYKTGHRYYIRQEYAAKVRELGLSRGDLSFSKRVPPWIFTASRACREAFVRGYYLTDGGTSYRSVMFTSVSEHLLRDLQVVLYSLGIKNTLKGFNRRKENERDYWRLYVSPASRGILFNIFRGLSGAKIERLARACRKSLTNRGKGDYLPPRLAKRVALDWQNSFVHLPCPSKEYYRRQAMFQKFSSGKGSISFARSLFLSEEISELVSRTYLRVVSVEDTGKKVEMFDLTVKPSHQYAAWNGVIMHNSGQDFLKASLIRADWNLFNPDKVIQSRMALKSSHKAYVADTARRVEKIRKEMKLAKCQWVLQVHDEAIWFCEKSAVEEMLNLCAEVMCFRHYFPAILPYCVPLVADGGAGENWQHAKSKEAQFRVEYGFQNEVEG